MSGWSKCEGKAIFGFATQTYTDKWVPIGFDHVHAGDSEQDWMYFEKTITIPAKGAMLGIGLYIKGNGKIWLDDVVVTPQKR